MTSPKRRSPIQNMADLLDHLVRGETLTSRSAARIINKGEPAARPYIRALSKVPGVVRGSGPSASVQLKLAASEEVPSDREVVAAHLGSSLSSILLRTSYAADLRSLRDSILRRAKVEEEEIENADRKFLFVPRGGDIAFAKRTQAFDEVVGAIRSNQKLRFGYQHYDGAEEKLTVDPYTLALYDHQFYVIGRRDRERPRAYRFSRMSDVDRLTKTFRYPNASAYSPEKVFADSFGVFIRDELAVQTVRIHLSGALARYAETHEWHRSQELEESSDGDGEKVLRLRVRVCPELVAWIVGLGAEAKVIAPPELREKVVALARKVLAQYEASPDR